MAISVHAPTKLTRSFFQAQVYYPAAGSYFIFALGENFVDQIRSGIASVLGNLTMEFFPYLPNIPFAVFVDINKSDYNLLRAPVVLVKANIIHGHLTNHCQPGWHVYDYSRCSYLLLQTIIPLISVNFRQASTC